MSLANKVSPPERSGQLGETMNCLVLRQSIFVVSLHDVRILRHQIETPWWREPGGLEEGEIKKGGGRER